MNKVQILKDIEGLKKAIIAYHHKLNNESIWLFLATMGSFSVYPKALKFYALSIIIFLFTSKVIKFRKANIPFEEKERSYRWYIDDIRKDIDECLYIDSEITKCRKKLDECKKLFYFSSLVKNNMTFFLCYIFSALTFILFLIELAKERYL